MAQLQGPGPGKTKSAVLRLHVNSVGQTLTSLKKNIEPLVKSSIIVGGLDTSQMYAEKNPDNCNRTEVSHLDTEEQPPDYTQSEYTTPYYITNDQAKASIKCLKTTAKVHHMNNTDTEHIRPLWVAQFEGSQVYQTDCEVNKGASCNVPPAHKAQKLFGQE